MKARFNRDKMEFTYKYYITDMLFYRNQNQGLSERFYDKINKKPEDTRSGKELAYDILKKAGVEVIHNESV